MPPRYFAVLGLPYPPPPGTDAAQTDAQIKAAYYSLAKRYHPDSKSGEGNVARFRQINHAFEQIKNKHARASLAALGSPDDAFAHARARAADAHTTAAYENYRTVHAEFADAEGRWRARSQNKRKAAFMTAFERLVHPRVLFVLVPLTVLAYCATSAAAKRAYASFSLRIGSPNPNPNPNSNPNPNPNPNHNPNHNPSPAGHVECWLNPKTGRLESAAPWDGDYRRAVARGETRLEERGRVSASAPPATRP